MTSEEIKNENKLDSQYFWIWLREIAYQLAVMNESQAPPKSYQGRGDMYVQEIMAHQSKIRNLEGDLDAANQHVKILEADRTAGIAACLRSCVQTIMENRMGGPEAAAYVAQYADTIQATGQQAGGPHTSDPAAQPNSNPKT